MTNFDNAADKMAKAIDDEIIDSLKSPNDIIKELALQATSKGEWSSVNNRYMEVFDKDKFAELIIRECGLFCGHDYEGVLAMFKHFGVEE